MIISHKDTSLQPFSSIVFFSTAHNGDVFYSKEYVRFFAQQLGVKAYYSHFRCPSIVGDLRIPHMRVNTTRLHKESLHLENGVLYINTWIAQDNSKWNKETGCTLKNNHRMYTDHAARLGLSVSLPEEHRFIPDVDWKYYGVDGFSLTTDRNVMVSNGPALSGQTVNWDMAPVIIALAKKHPSSTFYVTHPFPTDLNNIIDANKFFDYGGAKSNLNELSKLSTYCDIIVGRPSGPYCFTHIKENLFDENKSFVVSSNGPEEGHWVTLDDYSLDTRARQTWLECHVHKNNDCSGSLFEAVSNEISTKYGSA